MGAQQLFDFQRGDQLGILDKAVIPAEVGFVSSMAMKSVLRVINSYCGRNGVAWPSIGKIATEAGCSEQQVMRAIKVLEARNLLLVERCPPRSNKYWILWSDLSLLCSGRQLPSAPTAASAVLGHQDPRRELADSTTQFDDINQRGNTDSLKCHTDSLIVHTDSMIPDPIRTSKEPPPPGTRARAAADLWSEEEEAAGLVRLQSLVDRPRQTLAAAKQARLGFEELIRICDEFEANRSLFRSGGALVDRIRTGEWPARGVRSLEEIAAAPSMKTAKVFDRFAAKKYLLSKGIQGEELTAKVDAMELEYQRFHGNGE